jgi:hypothetical protein
MLNVSPEKAPDGTVLDSGQGYLDHIQAIQYCNAEIRVQNSGDPAERQGDMRRTMVADTVNKTSHLW